MCELGESVEGKLLTKVGMWRSVQAATDQRSRCGMRGHRAVVASGHPAQKIRCKWNKCMIPRRQAFRPQYQAAVTAPCIESRASSRGPPRTVGSDCSCAAMTLAEPPKAERRAFAARTARARCKASAIRTPPRQWWRRYCEWPAARAPSRTRRCGRPAHVGPAIRPCPGLEKLLQEESECKR